MPLISYQSLGLDDFQKKDFVTLAHMNVQTVHVQYVRKGLLRAVRDLQWWLLTWIGCSFVMVQIGPTHYGATVHEGTVSWRCLSNLWTNFEKKIYAQASDNLRFNNDNSKNRCFYTIDPLDRWSILIFSLKKKKY